jgi:hypothetical protein
MSAKEKPPVSLPQAGAKVSEGGEARDRPHVLSFERSTSSVLRFGLRDPTQGGFGRPFPLLAREPGTDPRRRQNGASNLQKRSWTSQPDFLNDHKGL